MGTNRIPGRRYAPVCVLPTRTNDTRPTRAELALQGRILKNLGPLRRKTATLTPAREKAIVTDFAKLRPAVQSLMLGKLAPVADRMSPNHPFRKAFAVLGACAGFRVIADEERAQAAR